MNERNRRDFLGLLRRSAPRQRTTTLYSAGGRVSDDQIGYIKEELAFIEDDAGQLTTRRVTLVESRICDCGAILSQTNSVQGTCRHRGCTRYLCTACMQVCQRCQNKLCSYHSIRLGDKTYCRRCMPVKVLVKVARTFFDIDDEENEK